MRLNITTLLFIALLLTLVSISVIGRLYKNEREERKRQETNVESLLNDVARYKVRDSLNVSSIEALTLKKSELENHFFEQTALIADLKIKIKRVKSLSITAIESNAPINTPVKDSVVYRDVYIRDTLRCIDFNTPYITLRGCINKGIFNGNIVSRDSLTQIVHRVPKRFLFFRYGTKAIRQEVVSSNPHTEIIYNRYIGIK